MQNHLLYPPLNLVPDKNILFQNGSYLVSISQDRYEVEKALALRYEVFCEEFQKGSIPKQGEKLETDDYDSQCHHLIVTELKSGIVVGTYRLQTYEMATNGLGFYSNLEFDLEYFPKTFLKRSVEIGRACIRKEFRNNRVLFLLWRGLAAYLKKMKKCTLFGCCSLYSNQMKDGVLIYNQFEKNSQICNEFAIPVQPDYTTPNQLFSAPEIHASKEILVPTLFQKYLDIGSKVASKPALDHDFGSIDFLVYLNITQADRKFLQFLGRGL
ncbi:MAG: GNAT family N-acyltransferase [Gracilimonas sp.]|nr:GNAT family N-acyltransferase [Gracilimonas sp.]